MTTLLVGRATVSAGMTGSIAPAAGTAASPKRVLRFPSPEAGTSASTAGAAAAGASAVTAGASSEDMVTRRPHPRRPFAPGEAGELRGGAAREQAPPRLTLKMAALAAGAAAGSDSPLLMTLVPNPSTTRGAATQISAHKSGNKVVYPCGQHVVIRDITVR
jgi:hypothetical protein